MESCLHEKVSSRDFHLAEPDLSCLENSVDPCTVRSPVCDFRAKSASGDLMG